MLTSHSGLQPSIASPYAHKNMGLPICPVPTYFQELAEQRVPQEHAKQAYILP